MLFWTRHANLRPVVIYIYDPYARIIKNPLILQLSGRVDIIRRRVDLTLRRVHLTLRRVKIYIEI